MGSMLSIKKMAMAVFAGFSLFTLQGCVVSSSTHQATLDANTELMAENQRMREQLAAGSPQPENTFPPVVASPVLTSTPPVEEVAPLVVKASAQNEYREWNTFEVRLGGFFSYNDSSIRVGTSAVAVDIDVEDVLDIDESVNAWRVDMAWRFSDNKKHRLDLSWFAINRDKKRTLRKDIEIGDNTIVLGTDIDSYVDLDVYQLAYSYSFFQDERVDLAWNLGLYIMPIDFGIEADGYAKRETTENFIAPMPVVGLRMDFALSHDWYLRSGFNVMYLEYDSYIGSIMQTNLAVEYVPYDHWAMGLGYDTFNVTVKSDGDDDLNVDLEGKFYMKYSGIQLYGKYYF